MNKYTDYAYIPARPDEADVLRRLGYSKNTEVSNSEMQNVIGLMEKASNVCHPKARCVSIPIESMTDDKIKLDNGFKLISDKLVKMLIKCDHVLLMAATLGNEVSRKIESELLEGDKVYAITLDGYASQCVDGALDYIMQSNSQSLISRGRMLTKHRFSPGYGNLDISYQKDLHEMLSLDDLGIDIAESFMLMPEKSVIAIAGIKNIEFDN